MPYSHNFHITIEETKRMRFNEKLHILIVSVSNY